MDSFMTDQDLQQAAGSDGATAAKYASSQQKMSQPELGADALGQLDNTLADDQGQQADEEPAQQLTETVAAGLQSMEERRQQLHAMIDELSQVGLHFLDQQRHQFIHTLESFKEEVDSFCRDEVSKGQQISYETIAAHDRLSRAQLLVQSLGGAVCQPGGAGLMG